MLKFVKKITPKFLVSWYHFLLAFFGAVFYGFPSKKMSVIGVTGTKGKTTTCNLIAQILNFSGIKTGMASTVNFRIGGKEWLNSTKQTMLGRFKLQKLLSQMAKQGCEAAVVETSSEGVLQHRQRFIDYDVALFANLSPEHIERHGSFENYRAAKLKFFKKVSQKKQGIGIYNLDDGNAEHFLQYPMKEKYGYGIKLKSQISKFKTGVANSLKTIEAEDIVLSQNGTKFKVNGVEMETNLLGEFNVYNSLAAICAALSQGVEMEKIKNGLKSARSAPGRMEVINEGQNFTAIVDYSYEPTSLENALKTIRIFNPSRIISVFGSAAGGRDKWRRPKMGQIADKCADLIIVTSDDPYDEDPSNIIKDITEAIVKNPERIFNENVFNIIDRREAIKKALSLAQENDVVLFSGKGGEMWMNVANGKKIPWDDAKIVKEELNFLTKK